jgi:transcriptional regulator PpsR
MPSAVPEKAVARDLAAQIVDASPDGIVVIDARGEILSANHAFLVLVQEDVRSKVLGTSLSRWLQPPGGDAGLLLDSLQIQRDLNLYPSTIRGSHGRDTAVEVAASRIGESDAALCGVYVRDVSRRTESTDNSAHFGQLLDSLSDQVGQAPLKWLVGAAVGLVERHFIEAALAATEGNRTAAAKLLELSRQSLYVKLARYGMSDDDLDG